MSHQLVSVPKQIAIWSSRTHTVQSRGDSTKIELASTVAVGSSVNMKVFLAKSTLGISCVQFQHRAARHSPLHFLGCQFCSGEVENWECTWNDADLVYIDFSLVPSVYRVLSNWTQRNLLKVSLLAVLWCGWCWAGCQKCHLANNIAKEDLQKLLR